MSIRRITKYLVAATLLVPAAAPAQERYSLSGDRVAIYNLAGQVHVSRTAGANVVIEVTRSGDDANQLAVERRENDGWSELVVRYPDRSIVYRNSTMGRLSRSEFSVRDDGTFGGRNLDPGLGTDRVTADVGNTRGGRRVRIAGSGSGLEAHANLRVLVPSGKAVAIHLGAGRVILDDVEADLQIDARSGAVLSVSTTGFLRIDTGSGTIHVDRATGDLALNTGSGAVKVTHSGGGVVKVGTGSGSVELNEVKAAALSVATGSGSINSFEVEAPAVRMHTGSGGIRSQRLASRRFDLDTGSGSINIVVDSDVDTGRIRSGSGSVTLHLARNAGAEVTLDTGSGGINVDVPVTVIEKRRSFFRGRIGDGRGTLDVGTGSGSITLR